MEYVDQLPPELRACVHDYGLTIVRAMLDVGVTQAKHIRHIVNTVRAGSIEEGNRSTSQEATDELNRRNAGRLRKAGYLVVPDRPTDAMVEASIKALYEAGMADRKVPRSRKHAVRLLMANVAGHSDAFGKP